MSLILLTKFLVLIAALASSVVQGGGGGGRVISLRKYQLKFAFVRERHQCVRNYQEREIRLVICYKNNFSGIS